MDEKDITIVTVPEDSGSAGELSGKELIKAQRLEKKRLKKEKRKKSPWRGFIRGMALGAALVLLVEGIIINPFAKDRLDILGISSKIRLIEDMIDALYFYDADINRLDDGIFYGLISGLTEDKYAEYYSPNVYKEEKKRLTGSYVGIGVTISADEEGRGIIVHAVNVDGPAARAGILEGDLLISADGNDLRGVTSSDAVSLISGEEGTEVVLRLIRDGEELEFTVPRETITTISVHAEVIKEETIGRTKVKGTDLGYISITTFNEATRQEFAEALEFLTEDEEVSGIIIDLRNNGGGDMDICLDMLDMILPDDIEPVTQVDEEFAARRAGDEYYGSSTLLLTIEGKDGEGYSYYAGDGHSERIPMVVVVNGQSASASEIFSGTLKVYGYEVVGNVTYGKGIVQSIYQLKDGSAVKFTTDQYRLADGSLIHGVGVEPTIEADFVEYGDETEATVNYTDGSRQDLMGDSQIQAAVAELDMQIYEAYQEN